MTDRRILRLLQAAKKAGCPRDQIQMFIQWGYIPQPKQLEFHAAARAADNELNPNAIACGGDRGGAKSHTIMSQVATDDCQRYAGLHVLYLRKVGKSAREALDQLRSKTFVHIPHNYNRNEGVIRFTNMSVIIVGHFKDDRDIDQYIGIEYDIIVIEEATQLSEEKVKLLLGSLRSSKPGWRARVYFAANPGGIGHTWFKKRFVLPFRSQREYTSKFIPMSWRDNKYVSRDYVAYLMSLTGVLARMWRDGDWDVGAGQFFTNWNYEVLVIKPIEIKPLWPMWVSGDHGFAHPTAVYFHAYDAYNDTIYTVKEHVASRWLVKEHARRLETLAQLLKRPFGDSIDTVIFGSDVFAQSGHTDKKGNSTTIASQYEAELGVPVTRANTDRVAGAAEMLRRMGNAEENIRPSWFIFDNCVQLIETIPAMLSDPNRPEDVLKVNASDDGEGGDDCYDAARYGLMFKPMQDAGSFQYQSRR